MSAKISSCRLATDHTRTSLRSPSREVPPGWPPAKMSRESAGMEIGPDKVLLQPTNKPLRKSFMPSSCSYVPARWTHFPSLGCVSQSGANTKSISLPSPPTPTPHANCFPTVPRKNPAEPEEAKYVPSSRTSLSLTQTSTVIASHTPSPCTPAALRAMLCDPFVPSMDSKLSVWPSFSSRFSSVLDTSLPVAEEETSLPLSSVPSSTKALTPYHALPPHP
mmetsp:Transcript_2763/g.6583  ORF Transcript_2763/g.6583 Transcript_2763/m.6583 type:complete len:220 (-) Transcript_2763:1167-1826(-)